MSDSITIPCPRCGTSTKVQLNMGVSSQRCGSCGNFLYGADTGSATLVRSKDRKRGWRSILSTAHSMGVVASIDPDSLLHDRKRGLLQWMPVTIVIASVVVIIMMYYFIDQERVRGQGRMETGDLVIQTSLAGRSQQDFKRSLIGEFTEVTQAVDPVWANKVSEVAARYLSTPQLAEILKLTRDAKKHEASITSALGKTGELPLSTEGIDDILYSVADNQEKTPLALLFFVNKQDRMQGIVLSETEEGIQVDWPSLSGQGDLSLKQFLEQKPTEPVLIRVAARRIDYYNYEFKLEDHVQALRMTEFPEENVIYGYVKKDSPFYAKVAKLPEHVTNDPENAARPYPLTMRASFRKGSKSPNQVDVVEILGNGWYVK